MNSFNSSTSSFKASEHQAAGHDGCMTSGSLFIKPATRQELDFYTETLSRDDIKEASENGVALGSLLSHWMPTCLGSLQKRDLSTTEEKKKTLVPSTSKDNTLISKDKEYIVLSNLYHGFKNPSILDIKLGSKLTDDSVTPEEKIKRLQQVSESTTSGSHSFRICGMKVYNGKDDVIKPDDLFPGMKDTITIDSSESMDESSHSKSSEKYLVYDKIFGRSFNTNTVQQGLELYFKTIIPNKDHFICLITNFIHRLQLLYNCLLDYETRSYSASLLFVYESDPHAWSKVNLGNYQKYDPLINEFELSDDDEEDDQSDASESVDTEGLNNVAEAYDIVKQANIDGQDGRKETHTPLSSLHLIDFAHSKYVDGAGYDENIIDGVENLIKTFQNIQRTYEG